jgi:D-alanine-D-alanine ligase
MKNILLLFGGESPEHEISIITAKQVLSKFNLDKYKVYPIYLDKDHKFKYIPEFKTFDTFKDFIQLKKIDIKITIENGKVGFKLGGFNNLTDIYAAFLTFHGGEGEGGEIQGFLETLKIPYTGPSVRSGVYGMDKIVMKYIFEKNDIPIVPWMYITKKDWEENNNNCIKKINKFSKYPLIVKPSSLGSSIGVKRVNNVNELKDIIDSDILYDEFIIIEEFKENLMEITYSIIRDKGDIVFSLSEQIEKDINIVYSYNDKYLSGDKSKSKTQGMANSKKIIPAKINNDLDKKIKDVSRKVYTSLRSQSLVRIDYLVDTVNNKFYTIEINTIPGSLSFYLWESKGIQFREIIDIVIENAVLDFKEKNKFIKNIDSPLWNL